MALFKTCAFKKDSINEIQDWVYGRNWPTVYIIYDNEKAYVGESLDVTRRTEQHLLEEEFASFSNSDICIISNHSFNKSVILDLESFLIKYMGADGTRKLTNANSGVVDHNYFYKQAYNDEFHDIWDYLLEKRIVQNCLSSIENSALFKYSPYKSLNLEQQRATFEILNHLCKINNASSKTLITVKGGAGTGKTILAVYLLKLLNDINNDKICYSSMENEDFVSLIKRKSKLQSLKKIGFVVPMAELNKTMKDVFKSIEGLDPSMVLSPSDVVKDYYDLLIVDEAHRLYRRKNLPGGIVQNFDAINKSVMGERFTGVGCEEDDTQLDWIIKSSRLQVIFYDELQSIRTTDIDPKRFYAITSPICYTTMHLTSQMRCKGGKSYYDYVKKILFEPNLDTKDYCSIQNYRVSPENDITEFFGKLKKLSDEGLICKVVSGSQSGWRVKDDVVINGHYYAWTQAPLKNPNAEGNIYSIHEVQGFDLDYAGIIFGREIDYNEQTHRLEVDKKYLFDDRMKSSGDERMREFVLNTYLTLMVRGIRGAFIYAYNPSLASYLKKFF